MSDGEASGTVERLAAELARVFDPLARRVEQDTVDLLPPWLGLRVAPGADEALGRALTAAATSAAALSTAVADLTRAIEDEDAGAVAAAATALLGRIATLVGAAHDTAAALATLAADPALTAQQRAEVAAFAATFVERLLGRLLLAYLEDRFPAAVPVLMFTGVVQVVQVVPEPGGTGTAHDRVRLRADRLGRLVTDPAGLLREVHGWGDPGFDGQALFTILRTLLDRHYRIPAEILHPPGEPALLEAFGFSAEVDPGSTPPGLRVSVRMPAGLTRSETVTEGDWEATFATTASFSADVEGTLRPPLEVEIDASSGPVDLSVSASVARSRTAAPFLLFGRAGGSRLEIGGPSLAVGLDLHLDPTTGRVGVDPEITVGLRGGHLVISGDGGDGFVATLLSGIRLESGFDTAMTWRPSTGATFTGSAALEIALPAHVSLGPLEVVSLYLRAMPGADGGLPIELSAGFRAALGPVTATVDRLGLLATLSFPPGGGNLGPADLALAFKPPTGVGLAIATGVVSGGGYLSLDPAAEEYAGALELTIAGFLSIKAIGLISTRLPGGAPGFSLLAVLTAEFTPGLQLGFGFTLTGVGGLLGLNRTMLLDPLVAGVRSGSLSSILFPTDVVADAPRILSDLRAIFPPREGTFLVGPMAKIGWGTPTLISVTLGVIIEIPGDVAILGRLRTALPTEDEAVLVLQVSFVGALEPDRRRLWFFATLFDSRVLFVTLAGELGLLMDFGDDPAFVLSVGGFHPRFAAPALPFPTPTRLAISLVDEEHARVGVRTYFAVTSNSVQMGAAAEAYFGFDAFSVEGTFGFDVLLRFSPFSLMAEISAGFSVRLFGIGMFGIHLRAALEGPTPWHIRGSAEISLLFFSFDVDVDVTFGERRAETLPPIAVLPRVRAEIEKPENWRATPPPSGRLCVTLRDLDAAADLVLHPVGTLRITQRFAPLNLPLDRVGNQRPSDVRRVTVTTATTDLGVTGATRERFAIAQYRDMDDAAKLSAPAFEPLDGGVELAAGGGSWATGPAAQRTVRYETVVVDGAFERVRARFLRLWDELFVHFRAGAAISRSEVSRAAERRLRPFDEAVTVPGDRFAVAFAADNRLMAPAATFGSHAEADAHRAAAVAGDPRLAERIHVIPSAEVTPAR